MTATTGPRLSAAIITRDEAADLPDCLASLAFCDEIVVVDSGSTDATVAIAEAAGAVVRVTDWPGFGVQKQRAIDLASGDYVLVVDADERIPADLAAEIRAAIAAPGDVVGWQINRRSTFLGRFLLHGGWYPDFTLRLARRSAARFTTDPVHERLEVAGPVARLAADMVHHSYRSIDEVLDKGRRYALASAEVRRRRGARGGLLSAILRAEWAFLRHYLFKAGFRDGAHGFVAALAKAQETFWRWLAVGWER